MEALTIQSHHPPNDPADFVVNRLGLPGVTNIRYDAETDQMQVGLRPSNHGSLTAPDSWLDAAEERDRLLTVLKQFLLKQNGIDGKKINVRDCSWPEVMELVRRAEDQYKNEKVTGKLGQLRKCLRKLGDNGAVFEEWLRILPDGDYGSPISGSFHVIIKTATEMSKVRECVFQALADIPEIISHAQTYVQIYRVHPARRLNLATAALYKAVLVSLRLILEYFDRKSIVKAMRTLAQGSMYDKTLVDSIQNIRTLAKKIKEEANQCSQERLGGVDQKVVKVDRSVDVLQANMMSLFQRIDDLPQALYRFFQSNPYVNRRTGQATSLMAECGMEEPNSQNKLRYSENSRQTSPEPVAAAPGLNPKKILKIMQYDQASPALDIKSCLELADDMDPIAIDRASWVMRTREFQSWLSESNKSRALLINGNSDPLENTSSLSLFCAHLAHLFVPAKPVIVVSYFCGLHVDLATDTRANAQGMMISLIGQLLLQARPKNVHFDVSFVVKKKLKLLAEEDLKTLCNVFRDLVIQLPKDRIMFCLIDGISLYESTDGEDDLFFAWQRLNQLLTHKHLKAGLKLLATSPGQALRLHDEDMMTSGHVLWVPEEVDGDRQGAWNSAEVDESINESFSSDKV